MPSGNICPEVKIMNTEASCRPIATVIATEPGFATRVDIVVRKMRIEPPQDFMSNIDIEDYNDMKRKVERAKHHKIPEDIQNLEVMRRFLYWIKKPRIDMCEKIQEWMRANDLVEENFDCGTQKKQRAKFAQ